MTQATTLRAPTVARDQNGLAAFAAGLGGRAFWPADAGYAEACRIWNAMIERRPALVVRPRDGGDVVACVRQSHGVDFAGYRRGTLLRRLAFRMVRVGARSGAAYLRTLHEQPVEVARLVEHLTVKVSRFYRNAPTFDAVRRLLAARPALAPQ